ARGYFEPNSREAKKYVEDAIKDLVSHEVGHTLGLRHNFRASTIHTLEQLHDKDLTRKEGITGSAMDYNPINLAGKGKKQGQFWQTSLGTYDYWAIEYAYKPIDAENPEDELKELDKIAARGSEPKLAYGTDEDAFGFLPQGIDPITNLRDLGSDPIAYYEHRLELAMELVTSMESKFARLGDRYSKLRLVLSHALREYRRAAATVPKFVGGIYHRRDHIGDPGNRMPFEPVNAAKQREALTFLKQQIFGRNAFQFTPGLMRRLPPERFYDFDWSVANTSRVDYPVHDIVLSIQKIALDRMYHAITLKRMLDLPLYHKDAETVFTMVEMFQEMRKAIWSEVDEKANINSFRRNLQRAHLAKLIDLAVKPTPVPYYSLAGGTKPVGKVMPPEDASTFARADLFALQKGITTALTDTAFDVASRAHLEESLARITAALNASVQREM
ncbi:MAG: zinc-dependent metalloprotease, partial [Bacteroidota bacterium]